MRKKILLILMAIITMFIVGCGDKEQPIENENKKIGKIVINDFETYSPDFSLFRILDKFGAINVNKDKQYVKSGNYSALLQPLGGYYSMSSPLCYYPFYSEKYEFDYQDLTHVKQFSIDVYNSEDHNVKMYYGLVMEVLNTDMVNKTSPVSVELEPGWNTITYNVDLNIISILYDVKKCEGFYFSFVRVGSDDINDAPKIYIDDLAAYYVKEEGKIVNFLELDENEICNFDKLYQNYIIYTECENPVCEPKLEVVNASDYLTEATSGNKVLKVTFYPGENDWGSWQRMIIPEKIMQTCSLKNIDKDCYDETYFCFDVYCVTDKTIEFYPEFFDKGYGTCYNKWAISTQKGKWVTCKIKLSELTEKMVTNPGFFRLAWAEFKQDNGEIVCLFDSFRIERKN